MPSPLLYEINTRCWLRELSAQSRAAVTLASVPDSELARWQQFGFTHIWLMGVWAGGPLSRACALADENLRRSYAAALPDWTEADVAGSPYAVADYRVPESLGGDAGLKRFRERLCARGMRLVLDFVPNHLGLDHPWVEERPDLFVQSDTAAPGTFSRQTRAGLRHLAHGRDPYFPPWTDSVQLDYRRTATRAAMQEQLLAIAGRCDGVRCDMAMLPLNDVFARTWAAFPCPEPAPAAEFWMDAIAATKQAHPGFLFLAEAYWGLEGLLQSIGFDHTYDKELYDGIVQRNPAGVQEHLLKASPSFTRACAHFLENHDEPRIASILSPAEHRPAALLVLSLPGMRFLHEGQLTGARIRTPVQLCRRAVEPRQPEIESLYEDLRRGLAQSAVGRGQALLQEPRAAWPGNLSAQFFCLTQWQAAPPDFDLAVVNLAPHRSQCYAPLTVPDLDRHNWSMKDLLGPETYERFGADLEAHGVYLDLPAHGAQLFHFTPIA